MTLIISVMTWKETKSQSRRVVLIKLTNLCQKTKILPHGIHSDSHSLIFHVFFVVFVIVSVVVSFLCDNKISKQSNVNNSL
jgi:hypothetical protein